MESTDLSTILSLKISARDSYDLLLGRAKNAALALALQLLDNDVEELCGKSFSHKNEQQARRGGSTTGSIHLHGAKHPIKKPRVRRGSEEVKLKSYEALKGKEVLSEQMLENMLVGVSTRNYEKIKEDYAEQFGIKKSTVSRAFIEASQKELDALNGSDLSEHSFLGIMIDGIEFSSVHLIVALGITAFGEKIPLGIRQGSSENAEVVKDLLASIRDRGFRCASSKLLCVIDGSKALKKGLKMVFGDSVIFQRCYLHKLRNLINYLPKAHHSEVKVRVKRMMGCKHFSEAKRELEILTQWLEGINYEAHQSILESGMEILTVHKLGLTPRLRKSLQSTNLIESLLSIVRTKSSRVKNWNRSKDQRLRWVASAINYHRPRLRKIDGCKEIAILINALNKNDLDQEQKLA